MKRHPNLIPISRQHRSLLMLAQLLKKNAPPYKGLPTEQAGKIEYALSLKKSLLDKHVAAEETVIFPFFNEQGNEEIQALCRELSQDHSQLETLFGDLQNRPSPELMDELGRLLETHIRKEERQLFQLAQAVIGEEKLKNLTIF